jgi:lysozyme family protein
MTSVATILESSKTHDAQHPEFVKALTFTLPQEGGFSDAPADHGGATNFGLTQKDDYDAYRRAHGEPTRSVREITEQEVLDIYLHSYWLPIAGDSLKHPLGVVLFDSVVNFGVGAGVKFAQSALGITVDGGLGPKTKAALAAADPKALALKICELRIERHEGIVKRNPSQNVFLKGWLNRDNALKALVAKA